MSAKTFHFAGYKTEKERVYFYYRIDFSNREPLYFTETVTFPGNVETVQLAEKFLDPLHLILGISYYKLYCPPKIVIPFEITKEEAKFWNTVYRKGLGEFLYKNNLDPQKVAEFPFSSKQKKPASIDVKDSSLLGIGGGKDSIVAAEMLKGSPFVSFLVETQREDSVSRRVIKQIGKPSVFVKRELDKKVFEDHQYDGHIPVSAVFAFLGLFVAALYKHKNVIVANEYSSNFGNMEYKGKTINHQWSKSAEFEEMFQSYVREFITPDINYFSLLRQFYEIRVAEMFSEKKEYFHVFTSCNRNFNISYKRPSSLWCTECPKCVFAFLILSPFLSKEELLSIFKKDLFANKSLLPLFSNILGEGNSKPFDCVGTFDEARTAFFLASKKFKEDIVFKEIKIKEPQGDVFKAVHAPTLPTPYRFLGIKSICVLGYGKEGRVSEKYIKQNYPEISVEALDEKIDRKYLKKQKNFDLAVKTPGIEKSKVSIPYVTATNIFFSRINNTVIGVTGSKGKSTTASLIYHILKMAGKKVRLLGNIGSPMLEVLLSDVDPEEIFVLELSSYMLDDIEYSPSVALLLNLFPEHMNYHGGLDRYYEAKKRIFKFQKEGDVAITPPFKEKLVTKNVSLLGEHNIENIKAATQVCRIFDVPESVIKKGVESFQPLPHRLEFVGKHKGVEFYDDAISTTPESTIEAIKALESVDTLILGGEDRGYDFDKLVEVIKSYNISNIVLFPQSGERMREKLKELRLLETSSMEDAVKFSFQTTKKGKICLLSTASPSYSLWSGYEEKGDLFKDAVKRNAKT